MKRALPLVPICAQTTSYTPAISPILVAAPMPSASTEVRAHSFSFFTANFHVFMCLFAFLSLVLSVIDHCE